MYVPSVKCYSMLVVSCAYMHTFDSGSFVVMVLSPIGLCILFSDGPLVLAGDCSCVKTISGKPSVPVRHVALCFWLFGVGTPDVSNQL